MRPAIEKLSILINGKRSELYTFPVADISSSKVFRFETRNAWATPLASSP